MRYFFWVFLFCMKFLHFRLPTNDDDCDLSLLHSNGYMPDYESLKLLKKYIDNIINIGEESYNTIKFKNDEILDKKQEEYNKPIAKKAPKLGKIYLIYDLDNCCYKIGFSMNPKGRLKQLQIATSNMLVLLAYIDNCSIDLECKIHGFFNDYRIKSEWFQDNDKIEDFFIKNATWIDKEIEPIWLNIRKYGRKNGK